MERKGTSSDSAGPGEAPLPAARAFVVQLRAQTGPAGEIFVGRVEHMASGAAERFGCAAELLEQIVKLLAANVVPQPVK